MKLRYRRAVFTIECKKPRKCEVCQFKGKIDLHHYHYEFKTSQIRKNKQLILKNTIWLCFHCHMVADAIRKIDENSKKTEIIKSLIKQKSTNI